MTQTIVASVGQHGSPVELYVDNGKVYHSQALTVACGQLGIMKLQRSQNTHRVMRYGTTIGWRESFPRELI